MRKVACVQLQSATNYPTFITCNLNKNFSWLFLLPDLSNFLPWRRKKRNRMAVKHATRHLKLMANICVLNFLGSDTLCLCSTRRRVLTVLWHMTHTVRRIHHCDVMVVAAERTSCSLYCCDTELFFHIFLCVRLIRAERQPTRKKKQKKVVKLYKYII